MKNFFIYTKKISLLLLLFLLLGLYPTSYADNQRIWTLSDLKNILYKMGMNYNANYSDNYIQKLDSKTDELQAIVNNLNNYQYIAISCYSNTTLYINCSNTNVRQWYWYRNQPFLNSSFDRWGQCYSIPFTPDRFEIFNNGTSNSANSYSMSTSYYYFSKNIYTMDVGGTLVKSAGDYAPSTFFDNWVFTDDYFTYDYNSTLNDIDVNEFPQMKEIYNFNLSNYVAEFGLLKNFDNNASYGYYYYDNYKKYWEVSKNVNKFNNIQKSDSLGTIYLDNNMLIPNTILYILLGTNDLESFSNLAIFFYVRDNHTIVNNGVVDVNITFSGDYVNDYNRIISQLENENIGIITNTSGEQTGAIDFSPIINNENDSSEVDSIMNTYLSGDSQDFASRMGYSVLENPFTSFLFDILDGIFDSLTDTSDITIGANYKTINLSLNSSDFNTPESPFKNFIRNMLICVYIYGNYKFFYHLIISLEIGDLRKFVALIGTDQFTDISIM